MPNPTKGQTISSSILPKKKWNSLQFWASYVNSLKVCTQDNELCLFFVSIKGTIFSYCQTKINNDFRVEPDPILATWRRRKVGEVVISNKLTVWMNLMNFHTLYALCLHKLCNESTKNPNDLWRAVELKCGFLNSIYFWKWTNANPIKFFRQLASHPKLLIGSKLSLG